MFWNDKHKNHVLWLCVFARDPNDDIDGNDDNRP